jgi:hypothetical protein
MESGDQTLKLQFQLLQERQLQRLEMRKKKEKEQGDKKSARGTASSTSLKSRSGSEYGVNDNLDLKVRTQPFVFM